MPTGPEQTHVVLEGSRRRMLPGARLLGRADAQEKMDVTVKVRRMKDLPELAGRPERAMTHAELAAGYGASPADLELTRAVLGRFGLAVAQSSPAARSIRFTGTVAQMENAFQVRLFTYAHESGNHRGRVGDIQVPRELGPIVQGVFGLDNRRVVRRRRQPVDERNRRSSPSSVPTSWYTPAALAAHYDFPSGDGSGQVVGILEFGGGYFEQDLRQFCGLTRTGVPTVRPVSVDGTPTNARDGAEGEVMLDVEVVAGACPGSTIVLYFAAWSEQGWIAALDAAIHDTGNSPGVLSASWGYAEDADIWSAAAMTQVNQSLKDAAYLGITVCVAAGDDGSSDAVEDGHAHVDFPASSPYVLSVGGTTITSRDGKLVDVAWKEGDGLRADSGGSTGGGVSAVFPRPDWQRSIPIVSVNPGSIAGRVVPDLAANADWNASPYLLVVDGSAQPNGGTSAAAPLVAALVTLINADRNGRRLGYVTPLLYQPASPGGPPAPAGSAGCTDVTTGDNVTDKLGGYSAGTGFDAVSGWGVPDGKKLMAVLP